MQYDVKRYRECLVETLRTLISFCEQNHLTYMAAGGTCIGAVRHHGMIPWDDDIDIFMPREDFNRLMKMKDQLPDSYSIIETSERGYGTSFPKFYNNHTTLWEEKCLPVIVGVYVDIFPLDEGVDDQDVCRQLKLKYDVACSNYIRSVKCWSWGDIWEKVSHLHPMGFWRLFVDKVYHHSKQEQYLKELNAMKQEIQQMKGSSICSFDGSYSTKEVYDKVWFSDTVEADFEGLKIRIPKGYDAYLRHNYHDYMQFPPESKRQSTHSHFYINLEKGMTLEEVKAELHM